MKDGFKAVGTHRILYVMAAPAEYGSHLKRRFTPLMTGIGPVEAAVQLTRLLAERAAADNLPDLVVSLGSAGSARLEHTAVYQVAAVSYRDMDASALGFARGATPLLDLPVEVPLPLRVPGLAEARLSTGANVVSGPAYAAIGADMVDMETFAVLRACQVHDIPLIGLRGISDGRAEISHVNDWTEYLHVIDEKLADAVDRLEMAVADGTIPLKG
ncbi:5'-methylthioadenosine/S-adenosylhomocysteine nucleosidase [Shinella daejeonensis]|uniref:5'-methylthioadenosine/S-adenosylhomocysteine nucleosidase n=1 Tax=Shinella daejeonensis TaxID=659017 RepID=UPI0020C7B650|nr:5'-methylthioadenosine/S-adenosylhomocysteine nucleosidase [Shinella daejeonensis]MCP8897214.1 5'-methylthioadenosine/S-adenosylhomocysteine nucleosidase [Shinella daejeonensis]